MKVECFYSQYLPDGYKSVYNLDIPGTHSGYVCISIKVWFWSWKGAFGVR